MTPNPFVKQYLMTAGPTPVPPAVSQAMAAPMLYHRAPAFVEIYERVLGKLPGVFQTSNDVLCFSASGSGAMDSAAANLVRPGKPVLACAAGKFGERWIELCDAYGGETVRYEPGWGERLDPAEIDRLLGSERRHRRRLRDAQRDLDGHRPRRRRRSPRSPSATARSSSSTRSRASAPPSCARTPGASTWSIAGSQKALMCPPGLGFASVNQRALDYAAEQPAGRYFFDWNKTAKSQRKGDSPFTPAVGLFLGLDVALDMIHEEGIEDVFARHALLARATRAGVAALGLELFGDPDERSNVVTAVELPESIDGGKVPGALRKLGITANGGQNQLKGKIIRIAHCGYFGAFDILTSLSGLEMVLDQLGHEVEHGAGVGAAQRVFLEAGVPAAA